MKHYIKKIIDSCKNVKPLMLNFDHQFISTFCNMSYRQAFAADISYIPIKL